MERGEVDDLSIEVAAYLPRSLVNGPGMRSVLWVQGCPFRCYGCFNPDFLLFDKGKRYSIKEIGSWIIREEETEGVTFSGGEPFAQAKGLCKLTEIIKGYDKGIVIFTGYTKEGLLASKDVYIKRLLEESDLIIAGHYKKEIPNTHPILSSANQELLHISNRYRNYDFGRERKRWEYRIGVNGMIRKSGFPIEGRI